MIEEKVASEDDILLGNVNLEDNNYKSKILFDKESCDKNNNYRNHYKVHLREIFYKFRGKHIFPDRG